MTSSGLLSYFFKRDRQKSETKIPTTLSVISLLILFLGITSIIIFSNRDRDSETTTSQPENYNPHINPSDFTTTITNKYFALPVGKKMTYEAETDAGVERIDIEIESATRTIMGVETITYRDRVYLGEQHVEDTKDYLAQDKEGNVWYFGEDVNNYENGELKDHAGSWIAGKNDALPGIWIKAEHIVGDSYRQEYYPGQAEDMRNVEAINETVTIKLATYSGCVKMYDWTPLDPESKEYKYYCPEVGALVLEENVTDSTRAELKTITSL